MVLDLGIGLMGFCARSWGILFKAGEASIKISNPHGMYICEQDRTLRNFLILSPLKQCHKYMISFHFLYQLTKLPTTCPFCIPHIKKVVQSILLVYYSHVLFYYLNISQLRLSVQFTLFHTLLTACDF